MKKGVFFVLLLLIITGVTVQAGGLSKETINTNNSREYNLLLELKLKLTEIEQLINIENTNITDNSSIQNEINDIKLQITKVENSNNFSNNNNGNNKIFENRLEKLEDKYIDTFAIEKNINFWLSLIYFGGGLLVTIGLATIGFASYKRGEMLKEAKSEIDKIGDIVQEKNKELKTFKDEFELKLYNLKSQAEEDVKLLETKYKKSDTDHNILLEKQNEMLIFMKNIDSSNEDDIEEDTDKYLERGDEYFRIGKNEEALIQYDKALEIDKDYVEALLGKIYIWNSIGDIDIAEKALDNWGKNNNNDISNFALLLGYGLIKKYGKADKQVSKMLKTEFFDNKKQRNIFYNSNMMQIITKENNNRDFIKRIKDKYGDK